MTVVDLYTIQIIDDGAPYEHAAHARVRRDTVALMAEVEENVTLLLPKGYRARIRRWDNPGTEDENDE